jgi:hypothetical protein
MYYYTKYEPRPKNQVEAIELSLFKYDTKGYHDFLDKKAVEPIERTINRIFDEHNRSAKNMSNKTVSAKTDSTKTVSEDSDSGKTDSEDYYSDKTYSDKSDSKIICTADNYKSDNYIYCKKILNDNKHMLDEVNKNYEVLTKGIINAISKINMTDKKNIYDILKGYHSVVSNIKTELQKKESNQKIELQNKTPEKKSAVTRIKRTIKIMIPYQTKLSNITKDNITKQIDELDELIKRIERIQPFYSDNPTNLITEGEKHDFKGQWNEYRNHPYKTTYRSEGGGRKTRRNANKRRKTIRRRI